MEGSFHGRKEILALIRRRVADLKEGYRQNIALLGSQYVGKSLLLKKFLGELEDSLVVPVYLDLEGRDFYYFSSKSLRSLLYHFSRLKGLPMSDDIAVSLRSLEPFIPQTVERARVAIALTEKARFSEACDLILSLPEVFTQETGLFCVIILDEFQALEEFGIGDIFRRLADRITVQKNCLYILSSSFGEMARRILAEKLTLLFGNFETVPVEPFDLHQSQEFITSRLGEVRTGLPIKNFLADFTGGRPLYLDILVQELISLGSIYKQPEVYAPLVALAVENMVFSRWGALSRHFELVMNRVTAGKNNRLVSDLIMALAEGRCRIKELLEVLAVKPSALNQKLAYLVDEDMVEKNGTHYHLKDKLFRYWVKYVYIRRARSIELEPGRMKKDFKEEITRAMNEFQLTSCKDLSSRVTELLHCFDNDQLDLKGRRYRVPAFRDIQMVKLRPRGGNLCDILKAETDEGTWLVMLRKDPRAEVDIAAVTDEAKSLGVRPRRCVIVSLPDLDDTVKLKALEERMWVWNEPELNSLMNLFDKPHIVP